MAEEKKVMRPDDYEKGDYDATDLYIIVAEDKQTILAVLYDNDDKPFKDADKNAGLFANSWHAQKTLQTIQELINFENRDLANKHPCHGLFNQINILIDDHLGR